MCGLADLFTYNTAEMCRPGETQYGEMIEAEVAIALDLAGKSQYFWNKWVSWFVNNFAE